MSGRVYITGDKHGALAPLFGLAEKNNLCDSDVLIVAGDAGYVWDADHVHTVKTLQQIFPGTVAFVDGNHENHALLRTMPVSTWCGGNVHQIADRVIHLMRGELYSIHGNTVFTFGGARSVDRDNLQEGVSWWPEEEPSREETEYGHKKLFGTLSVIDYVITHESPMSARTHISRAKAIDGDYLLPSVLENWYRALENQPSFKKWYFGHMHADAEIFPKLRAIHTNIVPIGEEIKMRWA